MLNTSRKGRSGRDSGKAIAVLMVVISLAAVVLPTFYNIEYSEAAGSETQVVYHISNGDKYLDRNGNPQDNLAILNGRNDSTASTESYQKTYSGSFVSTEYNPQVWTVDNPWFKITNNGYQYSGRGETIVFTGWSYAVFTGEGQSRAIDHFSESHYPGEVMSEAEMESAADSSGVVHVYATWGRMTNFRSSLSQVGEDIWAWWPFTTEDEWENGGDEYTNIVLLSGENSFYDLTGSEGVTIRGDGSATVSTYVHRLVGSDSYDASLNQDVIIDGIAISGKCNPANGHGDYQGGLYANGHVLVVGTGVSSSGSTVGDYIQLFGGSATRALTEPLVTRQPYGYDQEMYFGTFMIVHSGTFSSIVSGSRNQNISGTYPVVLSTYLVLRDVTVLDTVVGGNGGESKTQYIDGSAFTYAYGLRMYGDHYEESQIRTILAGTEGETEEYTGPGGVVLNESSIFTGGSNNGIVSGNTRIFMGGDTEVWDVQAGGRRGSSQVLGTASMEIGGDSVVKHVACGSITDGNVRDPGVRSVIRSQITVKDQAAVGSVFGAGYDTYETLNYPSMFGDGSSISITISGGTVGYVYGGGYRGSIGTSGNVDVGGSSIDGRIDSITISITGGKVLNDVFGGGRGGVDKPIHEANGDLRRPANQGGLSDSTGLSKVYVDTISIFITGGEVCGSVYGGGESVPVLTGYTSGPNSTESGQSGNESQVALVDAGAINISVGDCRIDGSVYGAGKGVSDVSGSEKPRIFAIGKNDGGDYEVVPIQWYLNSDSKLEYDVNYDHSGFAHVESGDISITFDGYRTGVSTSADGRVGSIYGGGMFGTADVSGSITIYVHESSVSECIYGGGMGTKGDTEPGSVSAGTIRIELSGETVGTNVGVQSTAYSVFGGGMYSQTKSGMVTIILNGSVDLVGDVHAGGMGDPEHSDSRMMDSDRVILVNGADVFGSIYGGSRSGQDDHIVDDGSHVYQDSVILLVAGTVTQSVYGGGFEGVSYLNSSIYVGTSALQQAKDLLGLDLASYGSRSIWIGNVYGGGNLSSSDTPYGEGSTLLMGNSVIDLAYDPSVFGVSDVQNLRIDGDLFGEGNYSIIGGTSVIYIHEYTMPSNRSMSSIQRCDELYIVNSTLRLTGSADGGVEGLTERYSIVRADMLQLDHSVLHLMAETSNILEYKSRVNGEIATKEDCVRKDGGLAGNEIVLHEGRPFTLVVTGANNVPTAIGTVSGYTLLSKPSGDEYYGVYAMGWEESDVESGFMVNDGAEEASVMDTPLTGGSSMILRTWYLAGHLTLGQQLVFDGYPSILTESGSEAISIPIQVPRFHGSQNSVFTYIGGFVDPTVQDGLYVVSENDYSNYPGTERRTYLGVSLSGSDVPGGSLEAATYHLTEGGDIWERNLNGEHQLLGSSNILTLTAKLFPMKGADPGSVGMLGTYTLHLTESTRVKLGSDEQGQPIYGYVPVNMIDIVLTVHVRPVMSNPVNIFVTVMASRDENDRLVGTGYINLPGSSSVLSSGSALTYRVTSAVADDGQELPDVYMWSDTTHLGQSGWTVITYTDSEDNRYHLNDFKQGDYFGEGGIRDTTIGFSYSGDGSGFTLTMTDDSSEARVYNIVVDVEETEPVDLAISYDPLDDNPRQYLSATGDGTQSDPYIFTWTSSKESFKVPYGTVIGTDESGSGTTLYYRLSPTSDIQSGNMWTILRAVLPTEGVELPDYGKFYYGENLSDLYVDPTFMTRYNPTSELKEDLDLYASFGLKITFHGQGVTVSPQTVFVQPGQQLGTFYNNILYEGVGDDRDDREDRITVWDETTVPKGYHLHNFGDDSSPRYSWAVIQNGQFVEYDFGQRVYQELDLYLVWDPNEYHVELTFQDQDGQTMTSSDVEDVTIEVEGKTIEAVWENNVLTFDTAYGYTMKTTYTSWIVTGLTVNQPEGIESVTIHGLNSGQVSVITPYAGEDGSTIEAVVTLAEGHTLYLEYTQESGDSIAVGDRLEVDFSQGGNKGSGTFAAGSRSLVFPLIGHEGFTVSLDYVKIGSTVFADFYWTYEVSTDGGRTYEEFQPADGIRGKTVGEYTLASVDSDVHLRIATYRAVHLSSVGEGISSVKVTSYEGDPEVHPSGGSNSVLFAGEVITATAKDGYIMPPADVQGVWAGSVSEDSMKQEFTVSGTRDVVLGDLTRGSVTISVNLELLGSDGILDVDDSLLATVYMGTTPYPFQIGFTDGRATVTMTVPYSGTGYSLDADISGFEGPSQNVTISATEIDGGRAECTITLTLITYHIVYHDTDGDEITHSAGSLTEWDVLNESKIPVCYHGDPPVPSTAVGKTSDGGTLQIWYLGVPSGEQDGTFVASESFCGDLYEGMFAYSITEQRWETHLFALPSPEGGSSTVQTSTLILVTTVSELNGPHVITGAPFQDERVDFTCASAPGSTFTYTPESGALHVSNAPVGTGLLHLVSGNYSVDIYVFADQDAEVEAAIP